MPGFDWNGNGKKDAFDHFMDNKVMSETSKDCGGSSSGSNNKYRSNNSSKCRNFGLGWVVIVIVVILLISLNADGSSWDAIDSLLGLGLLLLYICSHPTASRGRNLLPKLLE